MGKINAPSYTKKSFAFRNWPNKKENHCPVCGYGFISVLKTGVGLIYAHSDSVVCTVRNDGT